MYMIWLSRTAKVTMPSFIITSYVADLINNGQVIKPLDEAITMKWHVEICSPFAHYAVNSISQQFIPWGATWHSCGYSSGTDNNQQYIQQLCAYIRVVYEFMHIAIYSHRFAQSVVWLASLVERVRWSWLPTWPLMDILPEVLYYQRIKRHLDVVLTSNQQVL